MPPDRAGYSGTPLPRKLGIEPASRVLLDGPPPGFALCGLAPTVTVHQRVGRQPYDVIVVFCPDLARLTRRFGPLTRRLTAAGALWVGWPKRSGGMATDLTENIVREFGLAAGLVDVKVCAMDEVWSGLKFVVRLRDR
ncbi:MAG: DUF3052 domain-containing protein [Actinomycetota bacterium]|nr:DUF3052 domain-containing protein [Actinomycetota bacterium]